MRRVSTLVLALGFALVASIAQPLFASTIRYVTDAELIALSERVVHARVVAQRAAWGGPNLDRIYTVTTLEVLEDLTGRPGDRIEVWEMGGVIGDSAEFVGGQVRYELGSEVVVCLGRGPQGLRSVAMGFSKFDVRRSLAGEASLVRNLRDTFVVNAPAQIVSRNLDELRALAQRVTGRPSRRVQQAPAAEQNVEAEFTLLGPFRWPQADTSTPVNWRRNLTAASPLTSGNIDTEIGTALAAWTNPASASLILQLAGTTTQANPKSGFTGGVITFEDPNNEMEDPVLAIGGGGCTGCTTQTVNGTLFTHFTYGYVIFDNAATLDSSFRTPPNFTRVLQHEIGHAIGLGHTDDDFDVITPEANIMNSSCCYPQTPTPPAIGPDDLAGLNFIYPSNPTGPQMALDKTSLKFGAISNGASLLTQTAAQIVRLTQTGPGSVTWTATPNQPWLQVSPASGSGSANLSISVVPVGLPVVGTIGGAISLTFTGASNTPGPINVTLTLFFNGTSANPVGVVDTPADNQTGVTGAVPFTGWAVDDIEVLRVSVCRAAVAPEVAPVDPNCGGAAQIFVGFAVFIEGARPDVAAAFPTMPVNTKAGWGFMVLTNMLPSQGNGTFVFTMWAQDRDGHAVALGTRTMTCTNAASTKPFGAIDTPSQGGVASGGAYAVFGWVLSRTNRADPPGGGTVTVLVNGTAVGSPTGWTARPDLTALFPGFPGISTALGVYGLNTLALANGTHTIVWVVVDNMGVPEGIGSRFFTVSNGAGALTAAETVTAERGTSVPRRYLRAPSEASTRLDRAPLFGRRGWNLTAPLEMFTADREGRIVVRSEEVNRVELHVAATRGHLRTHEGLAPLPIGSQLDASTGVFTWAPGVGFVGPYDFEFVGEDGTTRDVRIVLQPKGSGLVGPQVVIDTPRSQQDVGQPFVLGGWAADLNAAQGTGVATLHAWAYPLAGGPPVFLGATSYGGARPDVAAVHGDQFEASGFGQHVQGLTPGNYDLAVFAWSTERADFVPARIVRVTVRP